MRVLLLGIFAVTLATSPARAQSGGSYAIDWSNLSAGGALFSTGGDYRLGGTLGQVDGGTLSGGDYDLMGGFWTPTGTLVLDAPPPTEGTAPAAFVAFAPAPNPSHGDVRFTFDLPRSRGVRVTLHDLSGRWLRTLLDGERGAGRHTVLWDGLAANGGRAPAGMYFVRIDAGEHTATRRFVRLD